MSKTIFGTFTALVVGLSIFASAKTSLSRSTDSKLKSDNVKNVEVIGYAYEISARASLNSAFS